ncbi:hypothetical protein M422DRAFT_191687 [Sphaerobolus stellatus SS14]|uniref:Uncharacterized protein n=1 Tax=Sphaerobolus stellatus (strain SS14) TaxID=990650 RepID=A0A0C9UCG1_SPHS4|nr:hypothetical protein M422DRAFT_191687 [Sphaerobolus stellatus SS14]
MFFSRVFSFAVLSLSVISAAATPVAPKKRAVSDVLAVVGTLQSSTGTILPQIDSLANSGSATQANISPLLANLVDALNTASTSLNAMQANSVTGSSNAKEVSNAAAPVVKNVATSLNNLKVQKPELASLFVPFGIDTALNELLVGLDVVVVGLGTLLSEV